MPTALYYPHTTIQDKNLLKNSLLLWDSVECVTPLFGKRPHYFSEPVWNEATELIVRDHVPSSDERHEVHETVERLVEEGLPDWFRLGVAHPAFGGRSYPIYPDKLLEETWHLLGDHHLAQWRADGDAETSQPLGLLVMALLADACAGKQKRKITDRASAYALLSQSLTAAAGGHYVTGVEAKEVDPSYDRFVSLSVRVLNTDDVPVGKLLDMRRRELRGDSSDYQALRKRYVEKVETYVKRLANEARTTGDKREIEREFELELKDDLSLLKSELQLASTKALLSKEVLMCAVAVAGAVATGFASLAATLSPLGVGALVKTGIEYKEARRKALRSHAMSWLYLSKPPAVRVVMRE